MATGTTAGLLDERASQSVFKHKILGTYLPPFVAMAGSKARDHRVVVLDGFAGRGKYPDGTAASGELILRLALTAARAVVEPVLVEKKPSDFAQLSALVKEYTSQGVRAKAFGDDVLGLLPSVVAQADGVPLFLFLDPCGAGLPFNTLARLLAVKRRAKWPPTEVLLNFSADLTRRAAGALNAGHLDHDALPVMDRTCGGPWWRQIALDAYEASHKASFEVAAYEVMNEYTRRLAAAGGMNAVTVPVRRRVHNQPIYHLVFLTRSPYGVWVFANAIAHARQEWMRVLGPVSDEDDGLFSVAGLIEDTIKSEQDKAAEAIGTNLRRLVVDRPRVRLVDEPRAVFGDQYGIATESTVIRALRTQEQSGRLRILSRAKQARDTVIGPPDASSG